LQYATAERIRIQLKYGGDLLPDVLIDEAGQSTTGKDHGVHAFSL